MLNRMEKKFNFRANNLNFIRLFAAIQVMIGHLHVCFDVPSLSYLTCFNGVPKLILVCTERVTKTRLDFFDLEHEALKILANKDRSPSRHALSLRERYEEIFLDEYQDTSGVQEEIFRLISRDGKNLFLEIDF